MATMHPELAEEIQRLQEIILEAENANPEIVRRRILVDESKEATVFYKIGNAPETTDVVKAGRLAKQYIIRRPM